MRIAVVTKYFPTPEHPWAGHSAYQTLRILARTHAVHVFYPRATYPAFLTPAAVRVPAHVDRNWKPADVPVDYIPYPALPVVTRQLNGFSIVRSVLPHVRAFRPDLILNYVVYPDGFAAVRIARALKLPSVLTAIGSDLNRIADPACGALIRYALRHATLVTTVSQALARVAESLGADPAHTLAIHNGCDTAIFHPRDRAEARMALNLSPAEKIIVYIGRLDRDKGLVELIDAMAQLRPDRPNLHCYLIGDGPDEALLRQTIAAHSIGDRLSLIPACTTEQVALWLAAADILTLPSYREGCPNVILEGLAAGRPIVATNVGGIPELMDSTAGRLVPPRDVPALTQALREVLDTIWNGNEISALNSRSWTNVAADLEQILSRALDSVPPQTA